MASSSDDFMRRYSLVLPTSLFDEVQAVADQHNTSVVSVLRRFIKLGLLLSKIQDTPGASLIIRDGDEERHLVLL